MRLLHRLNQKRRKSIERARLVSQLEENIARHPHRVIFTAPIFNCYPILIHALQLQTYPNWKLILVHDGPNTTGMRKLLDFIDDPRITYFESQTRFNDWGHSLRQIALDYVGQQMDGEFIVMTNADNYYVPGFTAAMIDQFKPQTVAVYCDMIHDFYRWEYTKTRLVHSYVDCGCFMVRRATALSGGWKSKEYDGDWTYIEEIRSRHGEESITKINAALFVHN